MKKAIVAPLVGVFALGTFASTASADHEGREFLVDLVPEEETSPVESDASGEAHLQVSEDGESLHYTVHAWDLEGAEEGHLHSGPRGEDGPVELFLFDHEPMDFDGEVATGTLTEDDMEGTDGDMDWEEFSMALVDGNIFVDIHTVEYPDGELRGQVDEYAEEAAAMPDKMPETGMGGTSNDGWFTSIWNNFKSFLFN